MTTWEGAPDGRSGDRGGTTPPSANSSFDDFFDGMRGASVLGVARERGFQIIGRAITPCPSCGAGRRERGRHRGPIGVTSNEAGFRCHRCDVAGDALDFVALAMFKHKFPGLPNHEKDQVRESLAGPDGAANIAPRPKAILPPKPKYPPADEVRRLWEDLTIAVTDDDEACYVLEGRGIQPDVVEDRDLARVLPRDTRIELPEWAVFTVQVDGRRVSAPWTFTHRLIFPAFDGTGAMRSVHGRSLLAADELEGFAAPKGACPRGPSFSGLVLADTVAQHVLATGSHPTPERLEVYVVEGPTDFLTLATHFGDARETPWCVLATGSGWWSQQIADRVPDGSEVILCADDDEAGRRYMDKVRTTIGERCVFSEVPDLLRGDR